MVYNPDKPQQPPKQESEPAPLAGDFSNIFSAMLSTLSLVSDDLMYGHSHEALAALDNEHFMEVVREARKQHRVRTIEEYNEEKNYTEEKALAQKFPEEVVKVNKVVHVLNTTEDPAMFKQALNRAFALTYYHDPDWRVFPQADYSPDLLAE